MVMIKKNERDCWNCRYMRGYEPAESKLICSRRAKGEFVNAQCCTKYKINDEIFKLDEDGETPV